MHIPLIRAFAVVAMVGLVACATTPESTRRRTVVKRPLKPAATLESDRRIAGELRAVTARVRKGESEALRAALLQQVAEQPKDFELQLKLAWMRAPAEEAWQDLKALSNRNATNPWPYWAMGSIYLQWGDFADQASLEFERALTLRRGFVPALVGKAEVLRQKGKLDEAQEAYQQILETVPDWLEAQRGLGLVLLARGEKAAGRELLEQVLMTDADDFEALGALASLAREEKDWPAAIRHMERLLEYAPKDRDLRLELARLREQQGDLEGAMLDYEAAAGIGLDRPLLETLIALYARRGDAEKEAAALERLSELDKEDASPLIRLAALRIQGGDEDGAETALRRAVERRPDDGALQLELARLLKRRDDMVATITAFRLAKEKGATEAEAELAELHALAGIAAPVRGDVNRINTQVSRRMNAIFEARRKENPKLRGAIQLRVAVDAEGRVSEIEILRDTVEDSLVLANLYFNLKDAQFPKAKRTFTFEFALGR